MPKIQPTITDNTHKWLAGQGKIVGTAAYILDSIPAVEKKFLKLDILNKFLPGELSLIIDVCNGLILTAAMAGQHLTTSVSDGIALDHLDGKWEIDGDVLNKKLAEMSTPELFFLELWACRFWLVYETTTLEEYIKL